MLAQTCSGTHEQMNTAKCKEMHWMHWQKCHNAPGHEGALVHSNSTDLMGTQTLFVFNSIELHSTAVNNSIAKSRLSAPDIQELRLLPWLANPGNPTMSSHIKPEDL